MTKNKGISAEDYVLSKQGWEAFYTDKGEAIFSRLLFDGGQVRKKKVKSPITGEKHASLSVYQSNAGAREWRFEDRSNQGAEHSRGNGISLLQYFWANQGRQVPIAKTEVGKALAEVYGIIQTGQSFGFEPHHTNISGRRKRPKNNVEVYQQLTAIEFKPALDAEEKAFWAKKLSVGVKLLEQQIQSGKIQLVSVSSFATQTVIEDTQGKVLKKYPTKNRVNLKHCYGFEIQKNEAYKLYMPVQGYKYYTQNGAKTTYLPNLAHTIHKVMPDYVYSLGIDALKAGQEAILTAGESDFLALKVRGKNAFTLGSELPAIPLTILKQLKAQKVSKLRVIYDTDFAGLSAAHALQKHMEDHIKQNHPQYYLPVKVTHLPKLEKQEYKQFPNGEIRHYQDKRVVVLEELPTPFDKHLPPYRKPVYNDICDFFAQHAKSKVEQKHPQHLPQKKTEPRAGRVLG